MTRHTPLIRGSSLALIITVSVLAQSTVDIPQRYADGYRMETDSSFVWTANAWTVSISRVYVFAGMDDVLPVASSQIVSSGEDVACTYAYDRNRNLTQMLRYSGGHLSEQTRQIFNAGNQVAIKTVGSFDTSGDTAAYFVDSSFYTGNQLTAIRSYQRDSTGALVCYRVIGYTYVTGRNDTLTQTLSIAMAAGEDPAEFIGITYAYNADHSVASRLTEYLGDYDSLGKPSRQVFAYTNGLVSSMTVQREESTGVYRNLSRAVYSYNMDLRLVKKALQDSASVDTRIYSYRWDAAGNLSAETDSVIGGARFKSTYTYEKITVAGLRGPASVKKDMGIAFSRRGGSLSCRVPAAHSSRVSLEVVTPDGRIVRTILPRMTGGFAEFQDVVKGLRPGSTIYTVAVRSDNRTILTARMPLSW